MSDPKTQRYYDAHAGDYLARFSRSKPDQDLRDFMDALPKGADVLDAGCGPGNSAHMMAQYGFNLRAIDASAAMVAIAREKFNVDAQVMDLLALDYSNEFDGIWANFSLLHLERGAFVPALTRLKCALKHGGVLHLGLKTGTGAKRDKFDRFYTYYTVTELSEILTDLGFDIFKTREGAMPGMSNIPEPFVIILAHG